MNSRRIASTNPWMMESTLDLFARVPDGPMPKAAGAPHERPPLQVSLLGVSLPKTRGRSSRPSRRKVDQNLLEIVYEFGKNSGSPYLEMPNLAILFWPV